ncbi:MAG: two-component system chemotaxis response regulator CheY [Gammaproteobacteria bacterium]|jgi:two-component system chemotaxis response regulator CheY
MEITPEIARNNILIVEDAISMRHTIKASLRAQGFSSLIEAGDGQQALKLMKSKKINLVICDWMMPIMSGPELFKQIQSDKKYKNLPFILLTGNDQKDSVTEALKIGIKHYVVKPFNPQKLAEKVFDLLQEQNVEACSN